MSEPEEVEGDEPVTCWCGAEGTFEEMFDDAVFEESCGGTHMLECECGGDGLCVCHHHGSFECPGCDDCEPDDEEEWDDPDSDHEPPF